MRLSNIMSSRQAVLAFDRSIPNGTYYLAFCDVSQHAACTIPAARHADPLDKDDGKYSTHVVGYADGVVIQNNTIKSVQATKVLLDLPKTPAEEAACAKVDSPLILDMAGNGIALSSIADGVSFDLDGDGKKNRTAWTMDADDMLLAYDINGNGAIDGGQELFGNHSIGPDGQKSANGFLSLAKYDSNHDGKIDAADAVFASLRLWSDRNHNGVSEVGEMISLAQAGVLAIALDYVEMLEVDAHGNEIRQRGLVHSADRVRVMVDAWLRRL